MLVHHCYYGNKLFLLKKWINVIFSEQKETRFFCPNDCGRSYKHKCSIGRHLKFECGVQPQFVCYICRKKFTDKQSMKRHVYLVHRQLMYNK